MIGSNLHQRGRTPLCLAIQNGHLEIVRLLVEGGANMDLPDSCVVRKLKFVSD